MKRPVHLILKIAALSFLAIVCRRDSSIDTSLFTTEVIDGVTHVHNIGLQFGDASPVRLELLGQIGKLEGVEEEDILYNPVDVARLPNGDILILEGDGCTVKRYDKDHKYISSFGQRGQGPGDFLAPYCLRLDKERNKLYIADYKISLLSLDGSYEDGFRPASIARFGSIGVSYRTSGMAVLSDSHVLLPSHPSLWLDPGEDRLLTVYDQKGAVIRSFGAFKQYDDSQLTFNANIVYFTRDSSDNIYVAYAHQNRIAKYSPEGEFIFSADRVIPFEIENTLRAELFKSGGMEREFLWPSVTSVNKGIHIDFKNRLWVLTFLKQPNRFLKFDTEENLTDCYEFDVFDTDGILLFKVPFPNVQFDNFTIYDDRLYLIDFQDESCVYEYRIVETKR
jgi:hypothetical protein